VVHVGSYGRRNHSCIISAQPVQGLGSYGNPNFLYLAIMTLITVSTTVLYCDPTSFITAYFYGYYYKTFDISLSDILSQSCTVSE